MSNPNLLFKGRNLIEAHEKIKGLKEKLREKTKIADFWFHHCGKKDKEIKDLRKQVKGFETLGTFHLVCDELRKRGVDFTTEDGFNADSGQVILDAFDKLKEERDRALSDMEAVEKSHRKDVHKLSIRVVDTEKLEALVMRGLGVRFRSSMFRNVCLTAFKAFNQKDEKLYTGTMQSTINEAYKDMEKENV